MKRYVEGFKLLSQADYPRFCRARLQEEIWGSPTQWQVFYERVRDPGWPDCSTEKDFHDLPDIIQKELITVFNYQPPKPI